MNNNFLDSVKIEFNKYKTLGEKTFEQVADDKLFWKINNESNSIAVIVKHLWGNMLSRWTDFLTSDGEKEWRERDKEFENDIANRRELLAKWNEGWGCLFNTINSLTEEDLSKIVYIRNEAQTVLSAINRQLTHYAYHVGQIVFIGKLINDNKWNSLSVPKGKSEEFNKEKFSKSK